MDETGEGQPEQKINPDDQPQDPSRRALLGNIIKGAGALAAKSVIKNVDSVTKVLPESQSTEGTLQDKGESDTSSVQDLENLPAGLGLAALATKQNTRSSGRDRNSQKRSAGVLNEEIGRRDFLKGAGRVGALGIAAAAGGSLVNLAMNTHIGEEPESSTPSEATTPAAQDSIVEISKNVEFPNAFFELFPNLTSKERDALRIKIDSYQKTTQEGGIGTLEQITTMRDLLAREYKPESGKVLRFEAWLQEHARENKINPNIAKAVIFIESHGRSSVESDAEAVGISQFRTEAAERYGLIVRNKEGKIIADYRDNPFMSVKAECEYLKDLRDQFGGNMGLAVWAYHAGEGNVIGALSAYFESTLNPPVKIEDLDVVLKSIEKVKNLSDDELQAMNKDREELEAINKNRYDNIILAIKNLVRAKNINVFQVLEDPKVKEFIIKKKLKDDTKNYTIKAAAAAEYFEKSPFGMPIPKAA